MRRILSLIVLVSVFLSMPVYAEETYNYVEIIDSVICYKSDDNEAVIIDDKLLENIGVNVYDWYAFCAGRLGRDERFKDYLNGINAYITNNDYINTIDYERLALVLTACGEDISGNEVLNKAVFEGFSCDNLSEKIVNHLIFALLVLDTEFYEIPNTADLTRRALISEILSRQLDSGAVYMMNKTTPETDLTAMMITSLFPYMNSREEFLYTDTNGVEKKTTVREAVEKGLCYLSSAQDENGAMINWGKPSCETTAQTIVALCTLGIDIEKDERFIKNGNTLMDGLMSYKLESGGFAHSFEGLGKADGYASTQGMYAVISYLRSKNGYRNLFDMREEQDNNLFDNINALENAIEMLDTSDIPQAKRLLEKYSQIPLTERMYVRNFCKLDDTLKTNDIENTADYIADDMTASNYKDRHLIDITVQRIPVSEEYIDEANSTFSILEDSHVENNANGKMSVLQITSVCCVGVLAVCVIIFNHTYLKRNKR